MSVRKSAGYIFSGALLSKIFSFGGSILLARILFPEDYAYILIANIFTGLIGILGNVGFEHYYLQARFSDEDEEDVTLRITSFLRLGLNTILFILQFGLSYIVEIFYQEEIVGQLLRIFSFGYLITGVGVTSQFILRKELNFKPESIANFFRDFIGAIVKVVCAYAGLGALSFAVASVISNIVRVVIILKARFYFPFQFIWNKIVFDKIFFFGKHSFAGGIGLYLVQQADKFLLSKFFPKEAIGFYQFSSSQANLMYSFLVHPFNGLLLSLSAKYKEQSDYLYSVLVKIAFGLSTFLLPITVFLFFFASDLFFYVFGEKWMGAVPLFQLFIVYNYLTVFVFPVGSILMAFGFPEVSAKLIWIRAFFLVVFLFIVAINEMPIFFYAVVFLAISFIFSWIKAYISLNKLGISLWRYIISQRTALYSLIVYSFGMQLLLILVQSFVFRVVFGVFGIIISFIIMNLFLFRKNFFEVVKLIVGENSTGNRILNVVEKMSNFN